MRSRGVYVVLDGPDGCGKTTQSRHLATWLQDERGESVLHVREPGSTKLGEALRALLLAPDTGDLLPITEALLFSAARAELLRTQIAPALQRGWVVVAERCWLSTLTYQGLAPLAQELRVGIRLLQEVTAAVHDSLWPDRIFVLDVDAATAERRRARSRGAGDRIEVRGSEYHQRVRDGYVTAARAEPRARIVDASRTFDEVQRDLRAQLDSLIAQAGS